MKHLLACKQIERMKNDIDYKSSIIKRLDAEIAQQNLIQKEEMDCVHAKFIAQIKKPGNYKGLGHSGDSHQAVFVII